MPIFFEFCKANIKFTYISGGKYVAKPKLVDAKLITSTLASVRMNEKVLYPKLYIYHMKSVQGIPKRVFVRMEPLECREQKCLLTLNALLPRDKTSFR